jgi:hypothetical protein
MTIHKHVRILGRPVTLALALALLALLGTLPAPIAAGPTLFTGVGKQSGGIFGPTLITTITGPTSAAPGVASATPSGGFTIPSLAFSRATPGYTFSLPPVYPYAFVQISQRNYAGSFVNSYLTPSVPVVAAATNAVAPYVTGTPRAGFVRLMPGSKGLGGRMPMDFTKYYKFDIATSLGILKAKALDDDQTFGGTSLGAFAGGGFAPAGLCCTTYPSGYPSQAVTAAIGTARGPWVTGMATAYDPHGAAITTTSKTAVDARSAFDAGVISLVTPRGQYIYQGDGGGTLVNLRDAFGIIHTVDITFAPEPGQLAMLMTGLAGLLGLHRFRRVRR